MELRFPTRKVRPMLLVARYVIPVSEPHIENGAVLVRDGRIVDVGSAGKLKTRYPNAPSKDFGLAAILPGFVDAHTHLEYSAMRGLINDAPYAAWKLHIADKEKMFSAADWDDSALLGALEVVRSGITTIADITATGASLKAARAVGLRGVIYREVGTMERKEVEPTLSQAFADVRQWQNFAAGSGGVSSRPPAPQSDAKAAASQSSASAKLNAATPAPAAQPPSTATSASSAQPLRERLPLSATLPPRFLRSSPHCRTNR